MPCGNNRGFSAAGENFSKNDQDQWKMTEIFILMGLFDIFFGQNPSWSWKIQKIFKISKNFEKKNRKKKSKKKIENFCEKKIIKKN